MEASKPTLLLRGFFGRCPHCGKGKLLHSYLKQYETCSACSASFEGITPHDGPAWLTILLVGHLLAPLVLYMGEKPFLSDTIAIVFLLSLALFMTLALLPRAKGLFITILWILKKNNVKP